MNSLAEMIRQSVSMCDICTRYGFTLNRTSFITCPFHSEKTASLKVYKGNKGWHCFGCGRGGSNIDFVKNLFGVDFKQAIDIIIRDFNLPTATTKSSYRDKIKAQRRLNDLNETITARQEERRKAQNEYDVLIDRWTRNDVIIRYLKPSAPDDEICDIYVNAVKEQPIIEYQLDCMEVN